MYLKLWNYYDSITIENLIFPHNLNKIKLILYPLDEGYEVFMKINSCEESMFFNYQDSRVLDSLDYGLLPTAILSGICLAKEQYLYSSYVIIEVVDKREIILYDSWKHIRNVVSAEPMDKKYLTILRITDNSIMKLTGIKSRLGDLREEQQWVSRKMDRLNMDSIIDNGDSDGYRFMNTEWFQSLVHKKHVSVMLQRKQSVKWSNKTDGKFHPDFLHHIKHTRLKKHLKDTLLVKLSARGDERFSEHKIQLGEDMMNKVFKLLENQKLSIFRTSSNTIIKYNDCHEECVHQMIIRSPLSGSNFKLILSRCPLHNRHWGHLIVDQWEGSSTKPIRFELPGGYSQGRRLLHQLSEMLGARISMNVESNTVTDANRIEQNISPKLEYQHVSKCVINDSIWESIESIMTKNIQSGKPLYDNRDNALSSFAVCATESDNSLKKKKSVNVNKNKLSTSPYALFQMASKNNASLKASNNNGESQQKQSLYSLKDLNLDDLF